MPGVSQLGDEMGQANTAPRLENGELVYIELRPDLDFETIRGNAGFPSLETRGIFRGFSLPIYIADGPEELFATMCVPNRWDGASDIYGHIYCWLSQIEDANNFKLQLTWEHYTPGTDVVPDAETNVEIQTTTAAAAPAFQSYKIEFQFTYGDLVADDIIGLRLRRIAADAPDCDGEIVINHYGVIFRRDKLGVTTP